MKKIMTATILAVLLSFEGAAFVFAQESEGPEEKTVAPLTEEQIAEVKEIHQTILAQKKMLIKKYVEYGKISEEQGEKITERFDRHYKMMEENGFQMPKMGRFPHYKQKFSDEE